MSARCKTCKKTINQKGRGRRPTYCSAKCRQHAYRKREANPMKHPLRAVKRDLAAKADHNAQVKAFVGGLNALGYKVKLERVSSKPNQAGRARPQLKVVGPEPSRDDQES